MAKKIVFVESITKGKASTLSQIIPYSMEHVELVNENFALRKRIEELENEKAAQQKGENDGEA